MKNRLVCQLNSGHFEHAAEYSFGLKSSCPVEEEKGR
jgi:hypothetical protein